VQPGARLAQCDDAPACAAILNGWIDATAWIPRVHTHEGVDAYYRQVALRRHRAWVIGDPVQGFLTLEEATSMVMALYVSLPGHGLGKALLDGAKEGRSFLELRTFVANTGARAFYEREGFNQVGRSSGDNEENLPDILLRWEPH
jgi:GNAT superfamily N-acetyltransferase